jgi:L-alanine-DL-glutamate epimerase-like enolase superfamily enzyme
MKQLQLHWNIRQVILDLKYTWKISRNASDQKTNLIVTVDDGKHSGAGEAAPNIRYNESADEGILQFDAFVKSVNETDINAKSLSIISKNLHLFNSLAFAIESAWFRYEEARTGKSFYQLASIDEPAEIYTSYTIPIMETGLLKKFYEENKLGRFRYIKLKVNNDDAFESLRHLLSFTGVPVMVDANESFKDVEECIHWIEKIRKMPLVLLEQPMPAGMTGESEYLKKYSPFKLFADESMTDEADFGKLKKSFDGVNMKLMKAGGFMNGIRLLKEAKKNNMMTMIGCMVETTLGISSGMRLCSLADYADLDSFLLLKEEPYKMATEEMGELKFMPGKNQ